MSDLFGAGPMSAISLWQPWATACVLGLKHYETRHWQTRHRGPLAIHAAKRLDKDDREWWARLVAADSRWPSEPVLGAFVGIVELTDIHPTAAVRDTLSDAEISWGNYGPDRFAWALANARPLKAPIPARGLQSIWRLTPELEAKLIGALA